MTTSRLAFVVVSVGLLVAGCKSAEDKCAEAKTAADQAWTVYIDALEAQRGVSQKSIDEANRTLKSDVDPRLGEIAKKSADAKFMGGSDAWLRGYHVAFNDACTKDETCKGLKHAITEATATIADLDERLPLAHAARKAVREDTSQAQSTAAAVILHPERPALKEAQAASSEVSEACKGVNGAP